jgi:hypothetical protein
VLELANTVADLRAEGILGLPLATTVPKAGTSMTNLAIPFEGVPPDELVVRRGTCTAGDELDVAEHHWLLGVLATACPGVRAGSSGSPLLVDSAIVGVISTRAPLRRAPLPCSQDEPCEIRPDGVQMVAGMSYATPTLGLRGCFGDDGRFDLGRDACGLEVAGAVSVTSAPPYATAGDGTWIAEAVGPAEATVRVKQGDARSTACDDEQGYGEPRPLAPGVRIEQAMPAAPGVFVTCVVEAGAPMAQAATALLVAGPIGVR